MTDNKDLQQLDEEQRQLIASLPRDLQETALRTLLKVGENEAKRAAAEVMTKIGDQVKPEQQWLPCCPLPTPLARVSPFYPLAHQKLATRLYLEDVIISDNPWGYLSFTGPQLSTFDEDILYALLALIDESKNVSTLKQETGDLAYQYVGSLAPLLKICGLASSGVNRKMVRKSLKRLMSSSFELAVYERQGKRSGRKRKVELYVAKNILTHYQWDELKKELKVTVNPFFREFYIRERITKIDVEKRAELKSPISKAIYRFSQSHRDDIWGPAHYLTLAKSINMNLDQPEKQIRRQIKTAISDLIGRGILTADSGFVSRDMLKLVRPEV